MKTSNIRVIRTTRSLALIISVIVTLLLPSVYYTVSYHHQSAILETEAEASAYFITQLINSNPGYWKYSQHRLDEALKHFSSREEKESRDIIDNDNNIILSVGEALTPPLIVRSYPLFDSGRVVAKIEVKRSLRPVLRDTAIIGLVGLLLGLSGYILFKTFPLKAISEALGLLSESEEKFSAITATAVDGILVIDDRGEIIYANQAAERLFGYTAQDMLSKNLHQLLVPGKYIDKYNKGFDTFKKTGQGPAINNTSEFTALKKDGTEFPIEVSTSAIKIKDKWHAVGLVHDITARKNAEVKLSMLYEEVKTEAEISKSLIELVEALNTSLEEKDLVRNILSLSPKYLKFDKIGLFFNDKDINAFVFSGAHGLSETGENMLTGKIISAQDFPALEIIMKGETVVIDKARDSMLVSNEMTEIFQMGSALLVPISFRGNISGMICAANTISTVIGQREISLLKGLADGIGIAFQNSLLFRESSERLTDLTDKINTINVMAKLDQEILSSIDKFAILRTAITLTGKLMPADRVAVFIKNDDSAMTVTEWGFGKFAQKVYDITDSRFDDIHEIKSALFLPEITGDSINAAYYMEQRDLGIKSSIILPLVSKSDLLGYFDIGSVSYGKLTPDHVSTAEKVASQIMVALEHVKLYEDLEQLLLNTTTSLISIIDAKSPWTKGHSERVTQYSVEIAKEMGMNEKEVNHIRMCGLLHDIGKIGTYDDLLNKPGKLTSEEFEIIKQHPGRGADIIAPIKQLTSVIPGVLHHHERYDGKGYPFGLKGEDIPLCASILGVADSFDAMIADRPYRKSPGIDYAISELKRCSGTQFNPRIVDMFLTVLERLTKNSDAASPVQQFINN